MTTPSIEEKFQEFHRTHPQVYETLRALALDLVERGHRRHLGIGMLWETMRYFTLLGATPEQDTFRLNNNYRSRYVRMLMESEPELSEVFETRELRAA